MTAVVLACLSFVLAALAFVRAWRDRATVHCKLRHFEKRALEAERLLRERGALAGELAHEIKNPITAILCSADALDLLIGNNLDENHRKCLRYIREYGDNLLRQVSDFLDLSRLESGQVQAIPESIELAALVESILGLLQSHAQQKKIILRPFLMGDSLEVFADPRHCKQVLFNLVHNAIKFTPVAGEVQVVVKSNFPQDSVSIAVSDNGCGIPAEHLTSIFDPYKRVEGENGAPEHGFGLGLAVCKGLIELAGGSITVKSEVGTGTCFEISLPSPDRTGDFQAAPLEKHSFEDIPAQPLSGQKFLLIDNDRGAREAMAQLIQAWGGVVDQVELAAEAIEAIAHNSYTTVLADCTGDGLYGYEVAQAISQAAHDGSTHDPESSEKELPTATIIVAARDEEEQALAIASGADACFEKPLNGKALLASLAATGKIIITH